MQFSAIIRVFRSGVQHELDLAQSVVSHVNELKDLLRRQTDNIEALKALVQNSSEDVQQRVTEIEKLRYQVTTLLEDFQKINLTPVADAVVSEVKANGEIPTPETVASAPAPANDIVQEYTVVHDAITALGKAAGVEETATQSESE